MISEHTWTLERLNFQNEFYDLNPGVTIVGRIPNANITLSSLSISRQHCKIVISEDESNIHIEDLGSGNGTYIENVKLTPKLLVKMKEGINIGIGTNVDYRCPALKSEEHYHFKLIKRKKKKNDIIDLTSGMEEKICDVEILSSDDDVEEICNNNSINNNKKENESPPLNINTKRNSTDQIELHSVNKNIIKITDHHANINKNDITPAIQSQSQIKSNKKLSLNSLGKRIIEKLESDQNTVKKNPMLSTLLTKIQDPIVDQNAQRNIITNVQSDNMCRKTIIRNENEEKNNYSTNCIKNAGLLLNQNKNTSQNQLANATKDKDDASSSGFTKRNERIKAKLYDPPLNMKNGDKKHKTICKLNKNRISKDLEYLKINRKLKLKELALNKSTNPKVYSNLGSKAANVNSTVIVKNTSSNRGSFLTDLNNHESQPAQHENLAKDINLYVSIEESIILNRILNWETSWLERYNMTNLPPICEKKHRLANMPSYFTNYDEYRRSFSDIICLEIWKMLVQYLEHKYQQHKMGIQTTDFQLLHALGTSNTGTVIRIHIRPFVCEFIPAVGSMVIVSFDGSSISKFGIIKHCVLKPNSNDIHHLEMCILLNKCELKIPAGSMVRLISICDIEYELSLLNAVYELNSSPLCENLVMPKYSHFPILDYSPLTRNVESLNYMQSLALCTNLASVKNSGASLQIIDGLAGTGKSTLICRMVFEFIMSVKNRKKVLICGSHERGVDNLLHIFTHLHNNEYRDLNDLKILRLGDINRMQPWAREYSVKTGTSEQNIDKEIPDDLVHKSIMKSDVIFTTVKNCTKLKRLKNLISWCLIDDTSYINEPEILFAVNLNVYHLVLVGNLFQFPDPCHLESLYTTCHKGSLFHRISQHIAAWGQNVVSTLRFQYRMHVTIQNVASLLTIFGKSYESLYTSSFDNPFPNFKIILPSNSDKNKNPWIPTDTISQNPMLINYSMYMARIAWAMYSYLRIQNIKYSITILVESSQLANSIIHYLRTLDVERMSPILVSTVWDFRGLESDIVLVCDFENDIIDNENLLKVAITRAKHGLYIFVDKLICQKYRTWSKLYDYAKRASAVGYVTQKMSFNSSYSSDIKELFSL